MIFSPYKVQQRPHHMVLSLANPIHIKFITRGMNPFIVQNMLIRLALDCIVKLVDDNELAEAKQSLLDLSASIPLPDNVEAMLKGSGEE